MFRGADVDGLDTMARQCSTAADTADDVNRTLNEMVSSPVMYGPYARAFAADATSVMVPALIRATGVLRGFAQQLAANAAQQRQASAGTHGKDPYVVYTGELRVDGS